MPNLLVNFKAQENEQFPSNPIAFSFYWAFLSQAMCPGSTDPTDTALSSKEKQGRARENGKCQKAAAVTTKTQASTQS